MIYVTMNIDVYRRLCLQSSSKAVSGHMILIRGVTVHSHDLFYFLFQGFGLNVPDGLLFEGHDRLGARLLISFYCNISGGMACLIN